jgi:hypothetical protein
LGGIRKIPVESDWDFSFLAYCPFESVLSYLLKNLKWLIRSPSHRFQMAENAVIPRMLANSEPTKSLM